MMLHWEPLLIYKSIFYINLHFPTFCCLASMCLQIFFTKPVGCINSAISFLVNDQNSSPSIKLSKILQILKLCNIAYIPIKAWQYLSGIPNSDLIYSATSSGDCKAILLLAK